MLMTALIMLNLILERLYNNIIKEAVALKKNTTKYLRFIVNQSQYFVYLFLVLQPLFNVLPHL